MNNSYFVLSIDAILSLALHFHLVDNFVCIELEKFVMSCSTIRG